MWPPGHQRALGKAEVRKPYAETPNIRLLASESATRSKARKSPFAFSGRPILLRLWQLLHILATAVSTHLELFALGKYLARFICTILHSLRVPYGLGVVWSTDYTSCVHQLVVLLRLVCQHSIGSVHLHRFGKQPSSPSYHTHPLVLAPSFHCPKSSLPKLYKTN